jgi:OOP family OmpA-OmpF porin
MSLMNSRMMGACVVAGLMTCAARAEDSGVYVGGSLGQARQKFTGFEGNDTAYKLFGGWSFNKYFAVEGGYVDAGTESDTLGALDVDISSDGFFVQGIGKWPLGRFVAPYAKFGYVFYDSTTKVSANGQSFSESENDADFIYGGGLGFRLGDNFRLRAEYEEVNLPESAFDIFSLAATWQF